MATIVKRPNGHRWIQFKGLDGKRKTLRLGVVSDNQASEVKRRVKAIIAAALSGEPLDRSTADWLGSLHGKLHDRVAATGLAGKRFTGTVGELADYCIDLLKGKPSTKKKYENTKANLVAFFTADRLIGSITAGDAEEFKVYLSTRGGRQREDQGLAPTTVQKRLRISRKFFKQAVKKGWIPTNPFEDAVVKNPALIEREFWVSPEITYKILDAIHDEEFQLFVAMVRFAALRCPSEVLPFCWSWIDWEHDSMTVRSPKTEHLPNGASRVVPIFAELRPYLESAWQKLPENSPDIMFPTLSDATGQAATNRLRRVCRRIGMELWPKPWMNMRSTRETELVDSFPIKSACEWVGNTEIVAKKHYLQVTKEHHARAVTGGAGAVRPLPKPEAKPEAHW